MARNISADRSIRRAKEAQALAQLQHPNVVAVHEVGADEDDVFVAMELIDGTSPISCHHGRRDGARWWRCSWQWARIVVVGDVVTAIDAVVLEPEILAASDYITGNVALLFPLDEVPGLAKLQMTELRNRVVAAESLRHWQRAVDIAARPRSRVACRHSVTAVANTRSARGIAGARQRARCARRR